MNEACNALLRSVSRWSRGLTGSYTSGSSGTEFRLRRHLESEIARRHVRMRAHAPRHVVGARCERRQRDAQQAAVVRVHAWILFIDLFAVCIEHTHGAVGGLEFLREPQPQFRRRGVHYAAHCGRRVLQKGVSKSRRRGQQRGNECKDADGSLHGRSRNIGLPMLLGKRSSMKKWICASQPLLTGVRSFMGMIASMPNCMVRPAQSTPGFIVPTVGPPPRSSGFASENSTSGIMRLNGSPKPTSFTKDWR